MTEDEQHLRWLSVFHYVLATLSALYMLFFVAVFGMAGVLMYRMETMPNTRRGDPPPMGLFAVVLGTAVFALLWWVAVVVGTFLAGRFLVAREHYLFCFVVAALNCSHFPLGTALGAFTILVLSRDSVKALFTQNLPAGASGSAGIAAPT